MKRVIDILKELILLFINWWNDPEFLTAAKGKNFSFLFSSSILAGEADGQMIECND